MRSLLFAILLIAVAGCASGPPAKSSGGPTVTCEVCRHNNDLACLCVKLREDTPRAEYQGRTYYFCSADCRAAFLKRPGKYLPKTPAP